jgi:phage repressor protein C with HTH and peptisase S24 domain
VPTFSLIRGKSPRIPVLVPSDERIDAVIPKTDLKGHDPKACRQFVVRTDTMAPAICPEDTIVVDTGNPNRVHYGAVHLLFWQGQSTLGRLLKEPDGSVIIQFDNPAYPVRTFSESDFSSLITVIGPVVLRTGSKFMARGLLV